MKTLFGIALASISLLGATPQPPGADTERLYRVKCASCHGAQGAGGLGASFKGKLAHPSMPELRDVIKNGIPGTAMPGSPTLPDPAINKLAAYVQYLHKKK